ncbi:MAG: GtrA family protein [Methylotenera sp.]|uniref:GtrA family protein n=1 Tax=Methylotenera sp. TaxID=2051956 RepID=UPI0017C0AA78|nr:GtrA family protein [Methylotenera sp.]NOU25661.1 GtrA family protein [Methylotenera sp.]
MSNLHKQSISWFAIIGALAAIVHYIVAVSFEFTGVLPPSQANIVGFLMAFPVSYFGHRKFSFSKQTSTHSQAFPRFLTVAVAGFIANQLLLIAALTYTWLPFWLALGLVMVIIAVSTYLLSRNWAFKHSP